MVMFSHIPQRNVHSNSKIYKVMLAYRSVQDISNFSVFKVNFRIMDRN